MVSDCKFELYKVNYIMRRIEKLALDFLMGAYTLLLSRRTAAWTDIPVTRIPERWGHGMCSAQSASSPMPGRVYIKSCKVGGKEWNKAAIPAN